MSAHKVNVLVPPLRAVPPAAAWLADAAIYFSAAAAENFRALRSRLRGELNERRQARARGELFALAQRYASTQPEFAKDLIAASKNERV